MTVATFRLTTPPRPAGAPTVRACRAARRCGLNLEKTPSTAHEMTLELAPGTLTLLVGASGAGKTTLLDACETEARSRMWRIVRPERIRLRNVPAIDQFPRSSVEGAMRRLARAGLGEASCFVRRPAELSAGQQARLRLAVALDRATLRRHDTLLVLDEFASGLDHLTARSLLTLLCRDASRHAFLRVLCATTDDSIALTRPAPSIALRVEASGLASMPTLSGGDPFVIDVHPSACDIRAAERTLGPLHYRTGRPASIVRTLLAREAATGAVLGMLVVAMPTLNSRVREAAWPGAYRTGDRKRDAARVNEDVRRIARVIVDPRVRSLGLAARLVRAYLDRPLTPRTEVVAAMGRCSGFFARAGMTACDLPPAPGDARLLDALAFGGLDEWRLAMPRAAMRRALRTLHGRLGETEGVAFLERELRVWANSSRARRHVLRDASLESMCIAACSHCLDGAVGYTHEHSILEDSHDDKA